MEAAGGVTAGVEAEGLVLLPPHLEGERREIEAAAKGPGRVLFATSGSSGRPKLVGHTTGSLRASAAAVNRHLGCGRDDIWLRAIPFYHVGGFALHVRAELAGGRVEVMEASWSPGNLAGALRAAGATVLSLVPAQVFDLVGAGLRCPGTLRAVVVGGGRFEAGLASRARDLGWPVLASYGSSEAGSQVATERVPGGGMEVLDGWEVRVGDGGELEIRGDALCEGYWEQAGDGGYQFRDPRVGDGWFATGDRAELVDRGARRCIAGVSRSGRVVKVLGELVDLDALEAAAGHGVAVVALADPRAGSRLVAVVEPGSGFDVEKFNARRPGFERLGGAVTVPQLPRTAMGKVAYAELAQELQRGPVPGAGR